MHNSVKCQPLNLDETAQDSTIAGRLHSQERPGMKSVSALELLPATVKSNNAAVFGFQLDSSKEDKEEL